MLLPSSVSATPAVIEIYFLIGNDSTPRELSPLFPFCSPSGGCGIHFPSLLAIGPSTIHSHWGFHALCCSSGLPSTSQYHDVASHPYYPASAAASLSLSTVGFLEFPFSRRLGTRFAVGNYGCVNLPSMYFL